MFKKIAILINCLLDNAIYTAQSYRQERERCKREHEEFMERHRKFAAEIERESNEIIGK